MATLSRRALTPHAALPTSRALPRFPRSGRSALLALVLLGVSAAAAPETTCPGIHVTVLNIRNSSGSVACALFESPEGFPREFLKTATRVMVIKVSRSQAQCDFQDLPAGRYALAVIHDENTNGQLDTSALGRPTEGYGFSNNATASGGAPSFADASMPYDGKHLALTISVKY